MSFGFAWRGIRLLVRSQPNARLHLLISSLVVGAGLYLEIALRDWAILSLAMSGVWVAEALNTALELTIDLLHPDWHPRAGEVKDVAAGAVLLATGFSVVAGAAVFFPYARALWT